MRNEMENRPIVKNLELASDFVAAVHLDTDEVICRKCWEKVSDFNEDGCWMDCNEEEASEMFHAGHDVRCGQCDWRIGSPKDPE